MRLTLRSLLLVIVAAACSTDASPTTSTPLSSGGARVTFADRSASLSVRVADTDEERARGLMGVTSLPPDEGMAFVWSGPTTGSFWMKNTLIPLSIAFIDEDGRVVTIREMTPCAADPCPTYGASGPYVLAVEANAGWYADHGIRVGDEASLENPG
jgi:uncharacterized membrane protein (UPF0127 family)